MIDFWLRFRLSNDGVALIRRVLGWAVVLAPLGSDGGWDPIRRLRVWCVLGIGGEIVVLNSGCLFAVDGHVAEGLEGFTVH